MSIGSKRVVVGAHYGLFDWLAQRITAIVLVAYLVVIGVAWTASPDHGYDGWAGLFVPVWMKVATLVMLAALLYHAWVGVRDIWMDYVRSAGLRLALQVGTILWLFACGAWAVQILWRV